MCHVLMAQITLFNPFNNLGLFPGNRSRLGVKECQVERLNNDTSFANNRKIIPRLEKIIEASFSTSRVSLSTS